MPNGVEPDSCQVLLEDGERLFWLPNMRSPPECDK
jgi:hypothetical protein